jgi:CheY-like chemotaxis protein
VTDSNRSIDVLLVEDELLLAEATAEMLEWAGYTVAEAENGVAALQFLRHQPKPALVLLDLSMPVMDGWEVCREVAADPQLRDVPIAVFTGVLLRAGELPFRQSDAGCLNKPFDADQLLGLARRFCGAGRAHPRRSSRGSSSRLRRGAA